MIPFSALDHEAIKLWLAGTPAETEAVHVPCETEHDWLTERVKGIGASEVGVITGASSFMSPYALWWRKKLDWRLPRTEAMQWGHLVEDPIADVWAEVMKGELFVAKPLGWPYSLWYHPELTWMTCTPDRLAVDQAGALMPVEIKSDEGGKGWGAEGTDEVPLHHRIQVSWQAHIFGADGGWVVRKRSSGKGRVRGYWIKYNAADVAGWIGAAFDFLESIAADDPPEPDGGKSTTEALRELHPSIDVDTTAQVPSELAFRWLRAREDKRAALAEDALASNLMRAALGRAEFGEYRMGDGFGRPFVKRSRGKRAGYSVSPGETDELREVNGGQHSEGGPVPGPEVPGEVPAADVAEDGRPAGSVDLAGVDFGAATAAAEERSAHGGAEREGVEGGGGGSAESADGDLAVLALEAGDRADNGGEGASGGGRCSCHWLGVGTPEHEVGPWCPPPFPHGKDAQ